MPRNRPPPAPPKGTRWPGAGRVKGQPNKITVQLAEMIDGALLAAGGQAYLVRCAKDPKLAPAFLGLVGRRLPRDININGSMTWAAVVAAVTEARGIKPLQPGEAQPVVLEARAETVLDLPAPAPAPLEAPPDV